MLTEDRVRFIGASYGTATLLEHAVKPASRCGSWKKAIAVKDACLQSD